MKRSKRYVANLEKIEKELTFHELNFILGSGGLSSKLNRYVREDNGYCYHKMVFSLIMSYSMFPHHRLFLVFVSPSVSPFLRFGKTPGKHLGKHSPHFA